MKRSTKEAYVDTIKKQHNLICRLKQEYTELLEENRKMMYRRLKENR